MARRVMEGGHRIIALDAKPDAVTGLAGAGADGADSLESGRQT